MRRSGAIAATLAVVALLAASAGCGTSEGAPDGPTADLLVTKSFGHEEVVAEPQAPLTGRRTVLRLLHGHADVTTIFDGRVIESIEELYTQRLPYTLTWSLLVNGIEADTPPVDYRIFPGDVVQEDLRYWDSILDVRATVGAFPETFSRGVFGRRFPVTVECEAPSSRACRRVKALLRRAGVPPDGAPPAGIPRHPDNPNVHASSSAPGGIGGIDGGPLASTRDRPSAASSRASHRTQRGCSCSTGARASWQQKLPEPGSSAPCARPKRA